MAPISPFFADWLFQNLNSVTGRLPVDSVHFTDFPDVKNAAIDTDLEERMKLAQDASSLILSLRKKMNIKVRQPLKKVLIPVMNPGMKNQLNQVEELIRAEVNIKEIEYLEADNAVHPQKNQTQLCCAGEKTGRKDEGGQQRTCCFYPGGYRKMEKEGKIIVAWEEM